MRLRIISTVLAFLISTAIVTIHYFFISPYQTGTMQINQIPLIIFLGTGAIAIGSLLTLIGTYIRHSFNPFGHPLKIYANSLRQGSLVAFGIMFLFFLKLGHLFNPFTILSSILVLIFIEWYYR